MYSFKNDYSEGAHPNLLKALQQPNLEQHQGYGDDVFCTEAAHLIKETFMLNHDEIHFFVGGTQTNLTVISAFLKPYEAVISADSGHVAVHETGAIEATGHKVIPVSSHDGKLSVAQIKDVLKTHIDEHMVKPKLVYLSNPTELGTIYQKSELEAIYEYCQEQNLICYLDGARLGSALCCEKNDLLPSNLAQLTDVFYIGGTKMGALCGEALVINQPMLRKDFRFNMKQKGALLAKGRILGLQFSELFKDNLYFELANHANEMARLLKVGISSLGYQFMVDSDTNQIFPIIPNKIVALLETKYLFTRWDSTNRTETVIRLVTSWSTSEKAVKEFIQDLKKFTVLELRGKLMDS